MTTDTVSENCPLIHRIMMLRWRVGIAVNQMIKCFNCLFRIKRWETLGLNTQTLLSHTLKHTSSRLIYYTLIPLMKFRFRSKNGIREELVCVVIVVRFRENGWTSKRERCVYAAKSKQTRLSRCTARWGDCCIIFETKYENCILNARTTSIPWSWYHIPCFILCESYIYIERWIEITFRAESIAAAIVVWFVWKNSRSYDQKDSLVCMFKENTHDYSPCFHKT